MSATSHYDLLSLSSVEQEEARANQNCCATMMLRCRPGVKAAVACGVEEVVGRSV